MKRNNGFIPGIKPGPETSDFISNVMDRIHFLAQFCWQL